MHMESKHGTVLCGLRGDKTLNPELVDCQRCRRMLNSMKQAHNLGPRKPATTKAVAKKVAPKAEVAVPKVEKEFPLCGCGCGERTKGGRFKPGHDARFYSQEKAKTEGPKAERKHREVKPKEEKPKPTGDHLIDTALGMMKRMNQDQIKRFLLAVNERYGMGTVAA